MSHKKGEKLRNTLIIKKIDIISIIPIMCIISIVPLIIYMKVVPMENSYLKYFWSSSDLIDMYTYYKSVWFTIFTFVGLLLFTYKVYKKDIEIKKTNYYIFMVLYALLVILSSLFSKYNTISFFGLVGRYEGMFVLVSYVLVLFLSINLINDDIKIKYVIYALFASAFIISIIGILQYLNYDILQSGIIRKMIIPREYQDKKLNLPFVSRQIYSTLAHSNYVGSYMAMLFPLSLAMSLLEKKKQTKILLGIFTCIMFAVLVGSRSRAGLVGALISVVVIVIMIRKSIIKNWVYVLSGMAILIVVFAGLNIISSGNLYSSVKSVFNEASKVVTNEKDINSKVKDINVDKNVITFTLDANKLKISLDGNSIVYKDEKDSIIEFDTTGSNIKLKDNRYKNVTFTFRKDNNVNVIETNISGSKIYFAVLKDGFKIVTQRGELVDLKPIEKWGFADKENLGSARGYIWSRSIPLLKNTIILGFGPDTFPLHFPQDDYIGKFINYDMINMFVDKPHNTYLNVALCTGVVSLIALLLIFAMYFISCVKIYFKCDYNSFYEIVGLAIFSAFIGYVISGVFNDSVVSVAPVFWTLLGIGISINMKLIKNKIESLN